MGKNVIQKHVKIKNIQIKEKFLPIRSLNISCCFGCVQVHLYRALEVVRILMLIIFGFFEFIVLLLRRRGSDTEILEL